MLIKLSYYWIISIDIYKPGCNLYNRIDTISQLKPKMLNKTSLFQVTEDQPEDEYTLKHRKYTGITDWRQTKELLSQFDFNETCQTMGSLTIEFGLLPAISFNAYDDYGNFNINAYVSPIVENEEQLSKEFGKLTEEQREAKGKIISNKLGKCLDRLENYLDSNDLPKAFRVNLKQLELCM